MWILFYFEWVFKDIHSQLFALTFDCLLFRNFSVARVLLEQRLLYCWDFGLIARPIAKADRSFRVFDRFRSVLVAMGRRYRMTLRLQGDGNVLTDRIDMLVAAPRSSWLGELWRASSLLLLLLRTAGQSTARRAAFSHRRWQCRLNQRTSLSVCLSLDPAKPMFTDKLYSVLPPTGHHRWRQLARRDRNQTDDSLKTSTRLATIVSKHLKWRNLEA